MGDGEKKVRQEGIHEKQWQWIQIFVKMDSCKTITQGVTPSDKVSDIMRRIQNRELAEEESTRTRSPTNRRRHSEKKIVRS